MRRHLLSRERERERPLTEQDREVVNYTRSRVKIKSNLTNLMKISRIEGYNGKYGSNPQENTFCPLFYFIFSHRILFLSLSLSNPNFDSICRKLLEVRLLQQFS